MHRWRALVVGVALTLAGAACSSVPSAGGIGGNAEGTGGSATGSGGAVQGQGGGVGSGGATGSGGSTGSGGAGTVGAAGGRAGGAADAGPTDTRMAVDAPSGSCAGLFCEDFESGILDPAVWDVRESGGQPQPALVSQAGLVAHGKYAARFHANPNVVSYSFAIARNVPLALQRHHFGRAYFMITPMPPVNHTAYVFAGTTGFPQLKYLEVASVASNSWQLTYVNLVPPGTGENYHSGGTIPLGKWFCMEWEFNDRPDQAAVSVDGTPSFTQSAFTFNNATTDLVGGFAAVGFGYYAWHPATYPFDVYYDDIVLDTKPIGCL